MKRGFAVALSCGVLLLPCALLPLKWSVILLLSLGAVLGFVVYADEDDDELPPDHELRDQSERLRRDD